MAVGFIEDLYNNSGKQLYVQSHDKMHNGNINGKNLDGGAWVEAPTGHSKLTWFGIPWFNDGNNYKLFSFDKKNGVKIYQSDTGGNNWIYYENMVTGKTLLKQDVNFDEGATYHSKLTVDATGGWVIEVVNLQKAQSPNPHITFRAILETTGRVLMKAADVVIAVAPLMADAA